MRVKPEFHELESGQVIETHPASQGCIINYCCIHHPSQHPLRAAPRLWNPYTAEMLRVCPHAESHPDIDDPRVSGLTWCRCWCRCCGLPSRMLT